MDEKDKEDCNDNDDGTESPNKVKDDGGDGICDNDDGNNETDQSEQTCICQLQQILTL